MRNLVILGAGGFAREASLLVEEINKSNQSREKWKLLGFIDEDQKKWGLELRGYPVLGGWPALEKLPKNTEVICVIGKPEDKKKMVQMAEKQGWKFASLIHPGVSIAADVKVGRGVLVNKGCLLTTNIIIGDHVSINPGCGIGHDVSIGDFTTLMWRVNISGAVQIGDGCLVGTGATILQEKNIGNRCVVGAGAVVTRDIFEGCTVTGIPAAVIRAEDNEEKFAKDKPVQ